MLTQNPLSEAEGKAKRVIDETVSAKFKSRQVTEIPGYRNSFQDYFYFRMRRICNSDYKAGEKGDYYDYQTG